MKLKSKTIVLNLVSFIALAIGMTLFMFLFQSCEKDDVVIDKQDAADNTQYVKGHSRLKDASTEYIVEVPTPGIPNSYINWAFRDNGDIIYHYTTYEEIEAKTKVPQFESRQVGDPIRQPGWTSALLEIYIRKQSSAKTIYFPKDFTPGAIIYMSSSNSAIRYGDFFLWRTSVEILDGTQIDQENLSTYQEGGHLWVVVPFKGILGNSSLNGRTIDMVPEALWML
jgi:hypothetical protein